MFKTLTNKIRSLINCYINGDIITFSEIKQLFYPILFDQFMVCLMAVLNSSMISSAGLEAVAAVNVVDSLNMFFMNFYIAIATGGTVVVAQYFGRRDSQNAGKVASQAIVSSFLMATGIGVVLIIFCSPLITVLFGSDNKILFDNAKTYFVASCISYPLFAVFQSVCGTLRGSGDTKASMFLSIILNVTYFALNFVFINILHMGVLGLSISIVVSRFSIGLYALFFLMKKRRDLNIAFKNFTKINMKVQKSILYIGVPTAAEQVFFHGGRLLTQTFITGLGTASLTVYAISGTILQFIQIPGNALCLLVVTVVGQCVGAGRPDEAKKLLKLLTVVCSLGLLLTSVIITPTLPITLKIFTLAPEISEKIKLLILISAIGNPIIWAASFLIPSGLRAAGDAKFTSITALLSMWLVRVVLGYVLGIILGFGIAGIWFAMVFEWSVRGIIFSKRMLGTKWYSHKVI